MEYDTADETQILETANTISMLICLYVSKVDLGLLLQENGVKDKSIAIITTGQTPQALSWAQTQLAKGSSPLPLFLCRRILFCQQLFFPKFLSTLSPSSLCCLLFFNGMGDFPTSKMLLCYFPFNDIMNLYMLRLGTSVSKGPNMTCMTWIFASTFI